MWRRRIEKKASINRTKRAFYVLQIGPYRFFFYAGDRNEPPHVHVERDENKAKFWLDPVRLQNSGGFGRTEINRIQKLAEENQDLFLRKWDEYFNE